MYWRVVVLATLTAVAIGSLVPLTPLGVSLGMAPPPAGYLVWLVALLAGYGLAANLVKKHYLRHYQTWL